MLSQLADKNKLIAEEESGSSTLMSNLIRAYDEVSHVRELTEKYESLEEASDLQPRNTEEILGNVLVHNFAEHDTTVASLAHSIPLLIAHPQVQDWIGTE